MACRMIAKLALSLFLHRTRTLICKLQMEIKWVKKNLHFCSSESAAEQGEMEVVLWCKNDVSVGAFSVNFTMPYLRWFVSHFTVGVMRLLLSSRVSVLIINDIITTAWHNQAQQWNARQTTQNKTIWERTLRASWLWN